MNILNPHPDLSCNSRFLFLRVVSTNWTTDHLLVNTSRSAHRTILPTTQTLLVSTTSLPGTNDQVHDVIQALSILDHREDSGTTLTHLRRISLHDTQIRANSLSKIDLVDDQQIRARDTGATLTGHLITTRYVNNVDNEVSQLTRIVRSKVITTRLDEQQISRELLLEFLKGEQIRTDVFTNRSVRAATCFDGADARRGKRLVPGEELGILPVSGSVVGCPCSCRPVGSIPREDIVGHGGDVVLVTESPRQC